MHDQALRERTHFYADNGLAVVLIVLGIVFMIGFIGVMAYAISSNAAKADVLAVQPPKEAAP